MRYNGHGILIKNMPHNRWMYMTPWGAAPTETSWYINTNYYVRPHPGGTAALPICRVGNKYFINTFMKTWPDYIWDSRATTWYDLPVNEIHSDINPPLWEAKKRKEFVGRLTLCEESEHGLSLVD